MKPFRMLGVMLDCSRNAVLRPEELYHFIDVLAAMRPLPQHLCFLRLADMLC